MVGTSGGVRQSADFPHRHEGDGAKTAAIALPGNTAETFLVHFFDTGLAGDRYVVESFRARTDGHIVPAPAETLAAKARHKTQRTKATLKAAKELRPACGQRQFSWPPRYLTGICYQVFGPVYVPVALSWA